MAGTLSTAIRNAILDHYTGKAAWTQPAAVYIGLSTTTPTSTGGNVTEPTTGAYARIQVTAAQFSSAAAGATENNADKIFAQASGDWAGGSNLTYLVIYDAITVGTFIGYGSLAIPKPVLSGDTAKVLSGDLDISIA